MLMEHKILIVMRTQLTGAFILLLIAGMLSSCEKLVTDVDVPKVEPRMVVFGFISPESEMTRIEVSMSRPVFGKPSNSVEVTDAVVSITNDAGQSIQLPYVDTARAYVVWKQQYAIEPGRTYSLRVSRGTDQAKASCTVPTSVSTFSDVSARKTGAQGEGSPAYVITYRWADDAQETNYYRTVSGGSNSDMGGAFSYEFCSDVHDDRSYNGKTISASCEVFDYWGGSPSSPLTVSVFLLSTDFHYYEYHRRRMNYYGDDPFSEPYPQYSNVDGGLGVFCSYRESRSEIKLE